MFVAPAARSAAAAVAFVATAALVGATIRVLPWLLDPQLPLEVVRPFARSLAAVSLEAALLTGWAIGFALAGQRLAERDEARVLALLGEAPHTTAARLVPVCLVFAGALASASYFAGRDAREPGRVLTELVAQGEVACARSSKPTTYAIPFADAAWLCVPGERPRLAAHGPGAMSAVIVTAEHVHFSDDLRRMRLEGTRLLLGNVDVTVREVVLRGLPPWSSASDLPTWLRAAVMSATGIACALVATWAAIVAKLRRRVTAIALGAAGPLAALGVLRALERSLPEAPPPAVLARFALVPVAGVATVMIFLFVLLRLPKFARAATRGS